MRLFILILIAWMLGGYYFIGKNIKELTYKHGTSEMIKPIENQFSIENLKEQQSTCQRCSDNVLIAIATQAIKSKSITITKDGMKYVFNQVGEGPAQ